MFGLIFGAVALTLAGFGGGWLIKGWQDGAEIAIIKSEKEKVESRNAQLVASNDRCATDIEGVRMGVEAISIAVGEREKAAAASMLTAQGLAAKHSGQAKVIKQLPPVPSAPEVQCAAMIQEQINYVESRHE